MTQLESTNAEIREVERAQFGLPQIKDHSKLENQFLFRSARSLVLRVSYNMHRKIKEISAH